MRIKSRERYNESSSFSNDLMKRKSFRASRGRGGGGLNSDEDYFRERYNESSSFSNNLMKLQSFGALRRREGEIAPPCPPPITPMLVTITYQYLARIISNLGPTPLRNPGSVYVCMYKFMYMYINMLWVCVCLLFVRLCARMCVCVCVCVRVCVCVCVVCCVLCVVCCVLCVVCCVLCVVCCVLCVVRLCARERARLLKLVWACARASM